MTADEDFRQGYFMHTISGQKFWPYDPRPAEVDIEVIAHHLAMQCRFNGAVRDFLSVAEHSWHCSFLGPASEALERLLHDAAEAYVGDIIRPLKMQPGFVQEYRRLEFRVERVIAQRFNLRYPWPESVKIADEIVVRREVEDLVPCDTSDLPALNEGEWAIQQLGYVPRIRFENWSPIMAKQRFLERFHELSEARNRSVA